MYQMIFILFFLFTLSSISCKDDDQKIINIDINEETPLSTILFTTLNNQTYRLFDSGRNHNSFIHYNISNGQIYLIKTIDRESLCSQHICLCSKCQLIIELIEWQLPYHLLRLVLNVEDINDHIPKFSSNIYQLNLIENSPIGYELPLELAHDEDLGENGRINYHLMKTNDEPFELILKLNGDLVLKVVKNIDRETKDFYEYELIADDNGQPKQQSSTKLVIRIDDVNDNPVSVQTMYIQLYLSEYTPIGTELTSINATDPDLGLNGKIHYSINNGFPSSSWMDYFRISNFTGVLTLINPLDYEIEQFYKLIIQVRDLGQNSLSTFITIDITVIDENDNYPQAFITFVNPIVNDSVIFINENTPSGDILAHLSVIDQDSGLNGRISHRIESGGDLIAVKSIDNKSFLLVIQHSIDREDRISYSNKLILNISDCGKPEKSIRLVYDIEIIDLNDSAPKFNKSINCNLHINRLQNQSFDEPLFKVEATDADLDDNGRVSYSIVTPNEKFFRINEQGEIFLIEYLNQTYYHLQIMANDHGKPVQLNSTYDCYLFISINNHSQLTMNKLIRFNFNYLYLFILMFILMTIGIGLCFYKFLLNQKEIYQENKTYHLYVSLPRNKSYYKENRHCQHEQLDEHQQLYQFGNDQLFDRDSMVNRERISRTIRYSYPSSICSMIGSTKIPHDSGYESVSISKQDSRPASLSISTVPTYINNSNSTIVRLAEEEHIDV